MESSVPNASKTPKIASKAAQDAPKRPPDTSKTPEISSKTPPRRFQDASKTYLLLSHAVVALSLLFSFFTLPTPAIM